MGRERINYRRDVVLLEASRILNPQFNAQGIWLSGAQVELLRNTTDVLNKQTTFVDEYHAGYYLTATNEDFDDIQAIVADLERKLMGNDNVMWGYSDRFYTQEDDTVAVGTTKTQNHTVVATGYVHRVLGFSLTSDKSVPSVIVFANFGGVNITVGGPFALTANVYKIVSPFDLVLKTSDYVLVSWGGLAVPQRIISNVWGYKMKVPA